MMNPLSTAPRTSEIANGPPSPHLLPIRDLVYQVAGIFQPDNKMRFLEDRCAKRMQVLGVSTLREYYECLTVKPIRQAEMVSLLNEITVGETCFFRNQPQLDALRNVVLPKIIEARAKLALRHLRIWSAGCSTGEESYTLSILLLEQVAQNLKGWTFEIVATDLNDNSIAKCKEGLYAEYAVRNLSPARRQKYFKQEGALYRLSDEVRAGVKFDRLNLQDQTKMLFMKGFDLVFCCNVLIYFDGPAKRRTVDHFYNALLPGGHFFLGECETLFGIYDQFRLVHFPGATGYLRPAPGDQTGAAK